MSDIVTYASDGGVARITFNRPEKLNALKPESFRLLGEMMERARTDDEVRVIVLAGEGRAFVAGADIEYYVGLSAEDFRGFIDASRAVVDAFAACEKPIIASVRGFALGGGFELVLASDLVVAADNARFGLPEAKLGLLPGGGGTQRLPRLVGRVRANELIMTGRMLTATEAQSWGLVNVVCPKDELDAEVDRLIDGILSSAPLAVGVAKSLIASAIDVSLGDGLLAEAEQTAPLIDTLDGREGIAAFVEKRTPAFGNIRLDDDSSVTKTE